MRLNPRATRSSAVSQSLSTKLPSPRRSIGWVSRPASPSVSLSAEPLEHRRPEFAGCDGSPEISAPPRPSGRASTPQPTPQYGHVVRTAEVSGGSAFMRIAPRGARPCGLPHLAPLAGRGRLASVAPAERSKSGEGALPQAQTRGDAPSPGFHRSTPFRSKSDLSPPPGRGGERGSSASQYT